MPLSLLLLIGTTALVLYQGSLIIYRLFLHPLAQFPGPKLAAVTFWWEFYQDWVPHGGGRFSLELKNLHIRYGLSTGDTYGSGIYCS